MAVSLASMARKRYLRPKRVEWKPILCFQLLGWLSPSCSRAHSAPLRKNHVSADNRCFQGFQMATCRSRYDYFYAFIPLFCS